MSTESKMSPRSFGFGTDKQARKDLRCRLIIKYCKSYEGRGGKVDRFLASIWKWRNQAKEKFTDC